MGRNVITLRRLTSKVTAEKGVHPLNTGFPSQICGFFFFFQSPSVAQRSVSQENAFKKKSRNPASFFSEL